VAARIQEVVARLARLPESGRPVTDRPGIRVAPLLRYRYNIFYAVTGDSIRILHIRHTSRRPWTAE
jgi:plasmid stabilization system protein ParE